MSRMFQPHAHSMCRGNWMRWVASGQGSNLHTPPSLGLRRELCFETYHRPCTQRVPPGTVDLVPVAPGPLVGLVPACTSGLAQTLHTKKPPRQTEASKNHIGVVAAINLRKRVEGETSVPHYAPPSGLHHFSLLEVTPYTQKHPRVNEGAPQACPEATFRVYTTGQARWGLLGSV